MVMISHPFFPLCLEPDPAPEYVARETPVPLRQKVFSGKGGVYFLRTVTLRINVLTRGMRLCGFS
jgi:hypothetical protein